MTTNKKPTGRAVSMPAGLTLGAAASLTITILSVMLIAKLLSAEYMEEKNIGYGVMITIMSASFLGAVLASARIKRRILLSCILSGGIYFCILLSITALFFGGQYEAVGVTAILVMGSAILAALTCIPGREKKKRRRVGK